MKIIKRRVRKNRKKSNVLLILFVFLLIVLLIFLVLKVQAKDLKRIAVYSWNIDDIEINKLQEMARKLDINALYQYIKIDNLKSEKIKKLLEGLKSKKINFYLLQGTPEQAYESDVTSMKTVIDKVVNFNQENGNIIKGIVWDVEFYLEEKQYQNENKAKAFEYYYQNMKILYEYAKGKKIEIVQVIPYWIDTVIGNTELEAFIRDTCDSIEVMNYYKEKSIEHIKNEYMYAQKYDKSIVTISELQEEDGIAVTEKITFYSDGLENCHKNVEKILEYYNYEKFGYAYHYYKYLKILYENGYLRN